MNIQSRKKSLKTGKVMKSLKLILENDFYKALIKS